MIKLIAITMISMSLIACGGGSDGGSDSPVVGQIDPIIGTYQAEIQSGGSVVRNFTVVMTQTPDGKYTLRDGGNTVSYFSMARTTGNAINYFLEDFNQTEAIHVVHSEQSTVADCIDNSSIGSASANTMRIIISSPRFTGGGFGTTMIACKLK